MQQQLFDAAEQGEVERVCSLLREGVDVNAHCILLPEWTALHFAVANGHVDVSRVLLEHDADANAEDIYGTTALQYAAGLNYVSIVNFLLDHGANAHAEDKFGRTALHLAGAINGGADVVPVLLRHGSNAQAKDKYGRTVMHLAAQNARVDVVRALLDHNVDATSRDREGLSPLDLLVKSEGDLDPYKWLSMARTLVEAGCEVDETTEQTIRERRDTEESDAMRVCLHYWREEKRNGLSLTEIPEEVFRGGANSVHSYVAALQTSTDPVFRHKVCVVGPTTWGKTSFIKSLTRSQSVLEALDTRTVGIDVFSHAFESVGASGGIEKHEVTFWDFAGQELYHSAHSVFFSRRTLFFVVVDLEAYVAMLPTSFERSTVADERLTGFVESNILAWLRLIFSRLPHANVAFVGTKKDRVTDSQVESVHFDLQTRAESWGAKIKASVPLEGIHSKSVSNCSHRVRTSLKSALVDWIVVSCVGDLAVHGLRRHLQELLVTKQSGFLMPDSYSLVLEEVRNCRHAFGMSMQERVKNVFIRKDEFVARLLHLIPSLHDSGIKIVMRTLHDLGDVIWYDDGHCSYPALAHQAVLAPEVLLDFIREVISHELFDLSSSPAHQQRQDAFTRITSHDKCSIWMETLQDSGEMDDGLLRLLPLWMDIAAMDDENGSEEDMYIEDLSLDDIEHANDIKEKNSRVLAIKSLLQDFGLAYPNDSRMRATSNLIIPSYWRMRGMTTATSACADSKSYLQETAKVDRADSGYFEWEYEFVAFGVPSTFFEQVVVRAYHPGLTQVVATPSNVVSTVEGESALRLRLDCSRDRSVLRVEAVAITQALARQCVLFACTAIEKELLMYPGLQPCRSSLGLDGTLVELNEEDDEGDQDVQWLRERSWMSDSALDRFPRAPYGSIENDRSYSSWWQREIRSARESIDGDLSPTTRARELGTPDGGYCEN